MKGDDRKTQIVETAVALFGRKGFSGTTTKSIAEAAGISEATIFRHFPSKEALYAEAFRQRTDPSAEDFVSTLRSYADQGDDEGLLRVLFQAILDGYKQDRDLHRLLQYAFLEQDAAENQKLHEDLEQYALFPFLAQYIQQRQAAGKFRPIDPSSAVQLLISLPVQYAIRTRLHGIDVGFEDDTFIENAVRFFLDGVRVAAEQTGQNPAHDHEAIRRTP